MMDGTRVYLVADFEPLRVGISKVVRAHEEFRLLGAANSLAEMADDRRFQEADVIVADAAAINEADVPSLYRKIGQWVPGLQMLFLGSEEDARGVRPEDVPLYMSLKTVGFILKNGDAERLVQAIKLVASGAFICEMNVIRHILTRLAQWADEPPANPEVGQLSGREVEVLSLVAQGRSNKEIAEELFVSHGTVKIHVSHIMTKLDLDRRTELVRFALARGLAPLA